MFDGFRELRQDWRDARRQLGCQPRGLTSGDLDRHRRHHPPAFPTHPQYPDRPWGHQGGPRAPRRGPLGRERQNAVPDWIGGIPRRGQWQDIHGDYEPRLSGRGAWNYRRWSCILKRNSLCRIRFNGRWARLTLYEKWRCYEVLLNCIVRGVFNIYYSSRRCCTIQECSKIQVGLCRSM